MPDNNTQFQQIQLKKGESLIDMGSVLKRPRLYYIQPNALLDLQTNRIVSFQNGMLLKIGENISLHIFSPNLCLRISKAELFSGSFIPFVNSKFLKNSHK